MSKTLTTSIHIQASTDQVWAVLSDLDAYRAWNPFIVSATGSLRPGEQLELRMQPVGGPLTTVRPRVLEVNAGRRLRWLGRFAVPGLFDAEHCFILRPEGDGTELEQREEFRGLLVPLFARMLDRTTLPAFLDMNAALKARVEAEASSRAR